MSKIVETIQNLENLIPLKPASIEDIENVIEEERRNLCR